jgi:hypothetical protein
LARVFALTARRALAFSLMGLRRDWTFFLAFFRAVLRDLAIDASHFACA